MKVSIEIDNLFLCAKNLEILNILKVYVLTKTENREKDS